MSFSIGSKLNIEWHVLGQLTTIGLVVSAITLAACYIILGENIFFSRSIPQFLNPVFIMVIAIAIWFISLIEKQNSVKGDE